MPKVRYPNVAIGIKKTIARKNNKIATKLLKTSWSRIRSNIGGVKKKERQGETQFTTKAGVPPPLNANVFLFLNFTLFMIKLKALELFSLLYR
jgi:hypothetical protein